MGSSSVFHTHCLWQNKERVGFIYSGDSLSPSFCEIPDENFRQHPLDHGRNGADCYVLSPPGRPAFGTVAHETSPSP